MPFPIAFAAANMPAVAINITNMAAVDAGRTRVRRGNLVQVEDGDDWRGGNVVFATVSVSFGAGHAAKDWANNVLCVKVAGDSPVIAFG